MKRNSRRTRWVAKKERKAYWSVVIGGLAALGFIALVVFGTPVASLKQMVLAQTAHKSFGDSSSASHPAQVHGDLINASSNSMPPIATNNSAAIVSAPPPQTPPSNGKSEHYETAGFDRLSSFKFEVSDEEAMGLGDATTTSLKITAQIPSTIKALNEKRVAITGFMLPLQVRHGQATEFLILKSQMMCCYGITPKMNEWVTVRTAGQGVKPAMDRPVTVYGTMHVGEIRDNKLLAGIYRVDADKMEIP